MKNIVCPVSSERISEHIPRVTAFLVVSLVIAYSLTDSFIVLAVLLIDFLARATDNAKYSPLNNLSGLISGGLNFRSSKIDKAPKIFAARLGLVLIAIAMLMQVFGNPNISLILVIGVGFFASLESGINFCVGCFVYSWLVLPSFTKK